jgi:hypothetical protein
MNFKIVIANIKLVFFWCYSSVIMVQNWCYNGVTCTLAYMSMSPWMSKVCLSRTKNVHVKVFTWFLSNVIVIPHLCHSDVTVVLQWLYNDATMVLQWCYLHAGLHVDVPLDVEGMLLEQVR